MWAQSLISGNLRNFAAKGKSVVFLSSEIEEFSAPLHPRARIRQRRFFLNFVRALTAMSL
jgi:ABC-type sugar transport system ATPase subunit